MAGTAWAHAVQHAATTLPAQPPGTQIPDRSDQAITRLFSPPTRDARSRPRSRGRARRPSTHSGRPVKGGPRGDEVGAPGRAPGRPAHPSSQTGRRSAVRPAWSPGDGPACGRPGRAGGPCRPGAWVADGVSAGGAGGRRWGRPVAGAATRPAGEPAPACVRDRALPLPASRTRVPFPRHRAPAREASVCSIGGSSARGTCVRKGRGGVGRNGRRSGVRAGPIWLKTAENATMCCNASCRRARHPPALGDTAAARPATSGDAQCLHTARPPRLGSRRPVPVP